MDGRRPAVSISYISRSGNHASRFIRAIIYAKNEESTSSNFDTAVQRKLKKSVDITITVTANSWHGDGANKACIWLQWSWCYLIQLPLLLLRLINLVWQSMPMPQTQTDKENIDLLLQVWMMMVMLQYVQKLGGSALFILNEWCFFWQRNSPMIKSIKINWINTITTGMKW